MAGVDRGRVDRGRVDPWPGWTVAGWTRGRVEIGRFPAEERKTPIFGRRYQKTNFRPVPRRHRFLTPVRFFELKTPVRFFGRKHPSALF